MTGSPKFNRLVSALRRRAAAITASVMGWRFSGISLPRQMVSAFPRPVQLAQAASECFDLLLVGDLLPLGQFECFQHLLHVVQSSAERLDDLVDFLDCFLNARR